MGRKRGATRDSKRPPRPRLFVGSSSEGKRVVEAIQRNLSDWAEVAPWEYIFEPSDYTLESLVKEMDRAQFGVFVFTPDDLATIRKKRVAVPRDNVVFELGLFVGRLGRERCFVLAPESAKDLHILTDLRGLTLLYFDSNRADNNLAAGTGPACVAIRERIEKWSAEVQRKQASRVISEEAEQAISAVLQVAARLIALQTGQDENQVRGFCHLFDASRKCLRPVAFYTGVRAPDDARLEVPCQTGEKSEQWYIVTRAFRENKLQCAEIDWKADLSKIVGAPRIWPDLKSVAAYPIRQPDNTVIGTVAVDSSKGLAATKWQKSSDLQALNDVLAALASTVGMIITKLNKEVNRVWIQ